MVHGNLEAFDGMEMLEHRLLLSAAPVDADSGLGRHGHRAFDPEEVAALASANAGQTGKKADLPTFEDAEFDAPVENTYFPLVSGTITVLEAEEEDGIVRSTTTITSDTKEILGVAITVVHDVETLFVEELGITVVLEDTFDWFAADTEGNVWYFGEDTTAFEFDEDWNQIGSSTEGSWEAGVDGAEPGIIMLANPRPGVSYRQEFAEGIAEDMGKVIRLNGEVSIELGDFEDVLVTKEWSKLEPGTVEFKYYAPGVGLVFVRELTGGPTVQVELVEIIEP